MKITEYHLRRLRRSTAPGCACPRLAFSLPSLGKLSWISCTSLGSGPGSRSGSGSRLGSGSRSGSGSPTTKLTGGSDISVVRAWLGVPGTISSLDPDNEESDGSLDRSSVRSMLPSKRYSRIPARYIRFEIDRTARVHCKKRSACDCTKIAQIKYKTPRLI